MTKRTRKILKIRNRAGILLPTEWLARNRLRPGSRVWVEVSDQRVTIIPHDQKRKAALDARFAKDVEDFLRRNRKILGRLARCGP